MSQPGNDVSAVTVPQLGVNDVLATVLEWVVEDESNVSSGDVICRLETAKAVYDVEADTSGVIVQLVDAGSEVPVKQPLALLGRDRDALRNEKKRLSESYTGSQTQNSPATGKSTGRRATRKASALALQHGVDLDELPGTGIISEKEVAEFIGRGSDTGATASDDERFESVVQRIRSMPSGTRPIAIYGAGQGAQTLNECLSFNKEFGVVCFVDDAPDHPSELDGLVVLHSTWLEKLSAAGLTCVATEIADGTARLRIREQVERLGMSMPKVVHPSAFIAPSARVGPGTFVKAGAVIETNVVVGSCCIVDNGAVIAHDTQLGDCVHLAPGVSLGSSIKVGDLTIVGIGASVSTGVHIGSRCIISVGSSVVRDVPDNSIVEGVPGRIIGERRQ